MSRKNLLITLLLLGLILTACARGITPEPTLPVALPATSTPLASPAPTAIMVTATSPAPTEIPATATSAPTNTMIPTAAPVVAIPSVGGLPAASYTDDRSTPGSLIVSLFNAINRHEYLRAYSYWQNPSTSLGTLDAYSNGYASTASIDLVFGQVSGDAGAGQLYYTVPVILKATATDGTKTHYAACYVTHLSQPGIQTVPPFHGMSIVRGQAQAVDINADDTASLATACGGADYPITTPVNGSAASVTDISKTNYLDNRSGAIEVVSSLENALNRKEYVRAYGYFQNPMQTVGSFANYANGFPATDVITASFGIPTNDAGAGQIYYKVAVALKVASSTGSVQTFVGCYTLHLSQPGIQGTLPFQPLGISAGKFNKVDNSVDTAPLLTSACN
jgi:hypothetical protein